MDDDECNQTKCSEDATILNKFVGKDQIYDFLAGVHIEFDSVRVQILRKDESRSLNEAIAISSCKRKKKEGYDWVS